MLAVRGREGDGVVAVGTDCYVRNSLERIFPGYTCRSQGSASFRYRDGPARIPVPYIQIHLVRAALRIPVLGGRVDNLFLGGIGAIRIEVGLCNRNLVAVVGTELVSQILAHRLILPCEGFVRNVQHSVTGGSAILRDNDLGIALRAMICPPPRSAD